MNENKFNDCLEVCLENCPSSTWVKDECYKLYLANWVSRKVILNIQSAEKILTYCKESLKKDYSLKEDLSRIGVQFLQMSGREKLSIPISNDIKILQYLV